MAKHSPKRRGTGGTRANAGTRSTSGTATKPAAARSTVKEAVPGEPPPHPTGKGAARRSAAEVEVRLGWLERWAGWLLGTCFFVLYASTTATGPVTGDNPEFVSAAYQLGVQHAPGYPLAAMFGNAFSYLPIANVTYAINLSAAAAGGATVAVIHYTAARWRVPIWAAALGAALYGLTPLVWRFFTQIEAFAFFSLFVAVTVYLLVRWKQEPSRLGLLLCAAVAFGLGVASHQMMVLLIPGILYAVYGERYILLRNKAVVPLALGLSLAAWLIPYAYELWAAGRHPVTNWGGIQNIGDLVLQLRRVGYTDLSFGTGQITGAPERLWWFVSSFVVTGLLLIGGAVRAWRTHTQRWYATFLLIGMSAFVLVLIFLAGDIATYGPFVLSRFFLMWHVVAGPFAALGIAAGYAALSARPVIADRGRILVPAAAACLALVLVVVIHPTVNQRGRTLAADFAQDVLASVPTGGVLLVSGDEVALPLIHATSVDEDRPDARIIVTPLLAADWYVRELSARYPDLAFPAERFMAGQGTVLQLLQANPGRQFFSIGAVDINGASDTSIAGEFYYAQHGLVMRFVPHAQDLDVRDVAKQTDQMYAGFRVPSPSDAHGIHDSFEQRILSHYASPLATIGKYYADGGAEDEARAWYERALQIQPDLASARDALAGASQ